MNLRDAYIALRERVLREKLKQFLFKHDKNAFKSGDVIPKHLLYEFGYLNNLEGDVVVTATELNEWLGEEYV